MDHLVTCCKLSIGHETLPRMDDVVCHNLKEVLFRFEKGFYYGFNFATQLIRSTILFSCRTVGNSKRQCASQLI